MFNQDEIMSSKRQYVEGDRTILVDSQAQFDSERQNSNIFRIAGKITNVIDNSVSGKTSYTPFKNYLYYSNPLQNAISSLGNSSFPWEGYPQYSEFAISRNQGITGHIPFVKKSASTYNWSFYLSYAFSSTTAQTMSYTSEKFNVTNNNFVCGNGIPYVIDTGTLNGKPLVYFYCATPHNLKEGQFVELSTPINGNNIFLVYSLGDGTYRSEEKVFTIYDLKYNVSEIQTGTYGTFKRIINKNNSGETKSTYYVRLHKILKTTKDCNIANAGFENNPFFVKSKLEYSALTPDQTQRVSVKDGTQTFSFVFDSDLDISGLMDNTGRPITQLYVTLIERGYMGWFNKPYLNQNGQLTGIDVGWDFNFLNNTIDTWWNKTSQVNKDNIPTDSYSVNGLAFYYNKFLNEGDIIKGDFCEYNYFEQKEYVLSRMNHKYSYNDSLFINNSTPEFPSGYVYNPHHPIQIKAFGDYIESAIPDVTENVPGYAWFSSYNQLWYWRDIYSYGYIDSDNIGVNYPFLNGTHYPFVNLLFLQYPTQRDYNLLFSDINQPTNDNCE